MLHSQIFEKNLKTYNRKTKDKIMTKTLIIIGIIAAVGAAVWCAVPALRGPANRAINNANEYLESEYCVDNYKAAYVSLAGKKEKSMAALQKFRCERAVAEKKAHVAETKLANLKQRASDALLDRNMPEVNRCKSLYDSVEIERKNYLALIKTYEDGIAKLEDVLKRIDDNMRRAKTNVDTLQAKKTLLDSMKSANKTLADLSGVGDVKLAINLEKLDDDLLRENVAFETAAINNESDSGEQIPLDEKSARAWLEEK